MTTMKTFVLLSIGAADLSHVDKKMPKRLKVDYSMLW
jgi:hypothetical protein